MVRASARAPRSGTDNRPVTSAAQNEQKFESTGMLRPHRGHSVSIALLSIVGADACCSLDLTPLSGSLSCGRDEPVVDELRCGAVIGLPDLIAISRCLNSAASATRQPTWFLGSSSTTSHGADAPT